MTTIPGNAARALWDSASRRSEAGIVTREGRTEYPRLVEQASAVAREIASAGLAPGDRVGIFLERGPEAVAAFYGILASGAAAVMVNETLRPRQVEHILGHSGARAWIPSRNLLAQQPRTIAAPAALPPVAELTGGDCEPVSRTRSDLAQIIYTSGSTGRPKGVAVSHGNLHAGIESVSAYLGLEASDRLASLLPFSFDYGLNQLLCAVAKGATLVIERSPLPPRVVQTLREQEVTVLPAVPPLWHQLLTVRDFVEQPLPALRIMTNTGGHLPREVVTALRAAQPQAGLYPMYGLTEAFRSTYLPPEEVDRRPGSMGKAIPGAEILVLRDDLSPCDPGEVGELVHRGPTVALGYWRDPGATAARFRPNPLRPEGTPDQERVVFSGDLVRRDEDGFLYFVGRQDRMIKTLGYRVSPDEVVDVLHASGQVVECVVGSEDDPVRGQRIVAWLVMKDSGSLEALEAFARDELPRYMQPARYEVRSALPRTASGKHDVAAAGAQGGPEGEGTG